MNISFKQKIPLVIIVFAIAAICLPAVVSAQRSSGNQARSYSKWGPSSSGQSYNQARTNAYPSQRTYYNSRRTTTYRPSYSQNPSQRYYAQKNYGYNRGYNNLVVSPYGLYYGNYGYGRRVQVNVPVYRGYTNYYRYPSGYTYPQYGYYAQPNSSYSAYATPATQSPGSYATPSYTDAGQLSSVPTGSAISTVPPSTYSTLKPSPDTDSKSTASNQQNSIPTADLAEPTQRRVESAFRSGQYSDAAQLARAALQIDPENGKLLLFSAQANFAANFYDQAIVDIGSATQRLPADQWNFVVKNYANFYGKDDYVKQMDRLTEHIEQNPTDERALILRGYQYGALGYSKAASSDFQAALAIKPDSALAINLQNVFGEQQAPKQIQAPVAPPQLPASPQNPPETQSNAEQSVLDPVEKKN